MKYHGIEFNNETKMSGVFRLGMLRFLEILYVEFHFTPAFSPKEAPEWPERWIDGKFRGAVDKLKDTFIKFDTIARYLSQSIDLALANKDSLEMSHDGYTHIP